MQRLRQAPYLVQSGLRYFADFLQFRLSFLQNINAFDVDNDGTVNGTDFLAFRLRFLQTVTP